MNDIKICVLGGDMRMLAAVRSMCKKDYEITVFGLEGDTGGALKSKTLKDAVSKASIIVLPLPYSTDGIRVFSPLSNKDIKLDELLNTVTEKQLIAGGRLSDLFIEKAVAKKCSVYDFYKSERLTILNAVATAEGALAIALNETNITLFGSKCAVLGYGRIGRVLARMLKNMGADVAVFARSEASLTWAEAEGYTALNFEQLQSKISKANIIFNTVPAVVIDKNVIEKTKENVTIIDLASAPGGVDFEFAKKMYRKVIFALSLPGKVAPESAGNIIADCILAKLKGGIL